MENKKLSADEILKQVKEMSSPFTEKGLSVLCFSFDKNSVGGYVNGNLNDIAYSMVNVSEDNKFIETAIVSAACTILAEDKSLRDKVFKKFEKYGMLQQYLGKN